MLVTGYTVVCFILQEKRELFIVTTQNMRKKFPLFVFVSFFAVTGTAFAQESADVADSAVKIDSALPCITMAQVLEEAEAKGDDFVLLDQTLSGARLQRSLDLAKQGLSVSTNGSWSLTNGFGSDDTSLEQSLLGKAEAASLSSSTGSSSSSPGVIQSAQGSLSVSTPLSKFSVNASHTLPASTTATNPGLSVIGLTGSQTVWDGYPGGQFRGTLEKSRLTFLGKEASDAQGRSTAMSKIRQSYIVMLAAQRDLSIKQQVFEKQSKLLAQIQAIYDIRQASAIDLKTAQINARIAGIDVKTADKTLRLANERLAVLIGRRPTERFSVMDVPDPVLPATSVEDAIKIGLAKRNDLAQFELSAKSANIDADLARALNSPAVSLTGGAGVSVGWTNPSIMKESLTVGGKITLPVYDSGAANFQEKTGKSQSAAYSLQAAQLRKTIASDIRDYFETTQLLAEKTELAKQSAELAEAQFELTKTQNKYGTSTMQDVLTASVTAATAEVNYGTAKNSYLLSELSLETAMGL